MSTVVSRPRYNIISGKPFSLCFKPEIVTAAINYKPTPSDIFVVTYPKCGTTWMIQIVLLILRKGKLPEGPHEYFASCPFLEMLGPDVIEDMPGPGCIKTHLPFELAPLSPHAKYIYVTRNPKDCLMSLYHHVKFFPAYYFTEGSFDEFFEAFVSGKVDLGDYFDHFLSWYKHRHAPNVFFTTYEDMKSDHRGTVLKVAKFLGEQYASLLEEDDYLLDDIVKKSSFSYMHHNMNRIWNDMVSHPLEFINEPGIPEGAHFWAKVTSQALEDGEKSLGQFIRSGQGSKDGKVQLSAEQERRLCERIHEKTKDSDVMKLWKKFCNK